MSQYILPQLERGDKWLVYADVFSALEIKDCGMLTFLDLPDDAKHTVDPENWFESPVFVNKKGFDLMANLCPLNPFNNPDYVNTVKVKRVLFNQPNPGFIYLMKAGNGTYKIGRTSDIARRIASLRATMPFSINLVHEFFSTDMVKRETQLHYRFLYCRVKGDWFKLSPNDINVIKAMRDEN